jgi:hypothetical protein
MLRRTAQEETPMNRFILSAFMLLTLALLGTPRAAHAETYHTCAGFITSLPTVISTQGTWCMKQDLTTSITSGSAITINTNNVTIDCNDFKLGGLGAGVSTQTSGIFAINRLNATVRHCNIRGFYQGVYFYGITDGGHLVEDNRFDGNTNVGVDVEGDGSVVRRNRVFDTGGATGSTNTLGIETRYSVEVLDNTVSGVLATAGTNGNVYGIDCISSTAGRIIGNGVRGLVPDGTGAANGIYAASATRVSIRDNDIDGNGGASSIGLHCTTSGSHARGNLSVNFTTGLDLCTDDGGNVTTP